MLKTSALLPVVAKKKKLPFYPCDTKLAYFPNPSVSTLFPLTTLFPKSGIIHKCLVEILPIDEKDSPTFYTRVHRGSIGPILLTSEKCDEMKPCNISARSRFWFRFSQRFRFSFRFRGFRPAKCWPSGLDKPCISYWGHFKGFVKTALIKKIATISTEHLIWGLNTVRTK